MRFQFPGGFVNEPEVQSGPIRDIEQRVARVRQIEHPEPGEILDANLAVAGCPIQPPAAERWLAWRLPQLSNAENQRAIEQSIRDYVLPDLGHRKLSDIRRRDLVKVVRDIAARHLEGVRSKLTDLSRLEKILASTVSQCSGGAVSECPVLDILDIERAGSRA